jgi:hypothetical protein
MGGSYGEAVFAVDIPWELLDIGAGDGTGHPKDTDTKLPYRLLSPIFAA